MSADSEVGEPKRYRCCNSCSDAAKVVSLLIFLMLLACAGCVRLHILQSALARGPWSSADSGSGLAVQLCHCVHSPMVKTQQRCAYYIVQGYRATTGRESLNIPKNIIHNQASDNNKINVQGHHSLEHRILRTPGHKTRQGLHQA